MTIAHNVRARLLLAAALCVVAGAHSAAQTPNAADGPWSGQMQCVLSVKGPNYQDDQTHTWRIIPGPPVLNGVFRQWPAVWSAKGGGSRMLQTGGSETWKIAVPETNAPLAFSVNAAIGQMRIGSQHGLLNINGAISGSTEGARAAPIVSALQEWPFPILDDAATATTISGTRTRTVPAANGWRPPPGVPTTETCTWRFDKVPATAAAESQSSAATGTTTGSQTTLRSAGAGTIQSTTTDTTSDTALRRAGSTLSDGAIAGLSALMITVTYPNGGETVTLGTPITIQWSHQLPNATAFTADVSYDGGATWTPTNSSESGAGPTASLNWTVVGNASTRARVRVRATDGSFSDQSNADFTIAGSSSGSGGTSTSSGGTTSCTGTCTVRVTSPNGGETWGYAELGSTASTGVTWTSTYPSTQSFDVNFSDNGGATWQRLTRTTSATGISLSALRQQANWRVPYTDRALFNVTPSNGPSGDTSDAVFRIPKPIAVLSPNGGETLTVGTAADVRFTTQIPQQTGYSYVLQVSYDGGTTWINPRGVSVSGTAGSFRWTVAGPPATRARLRVFLTTGTIPDPGTEGTMPTNTPNDESDAEFAIAQ